MRRRGILRLVGASAVVGAVVAVSVHGLQTAPSAPTQRALRGDANLLVAGDIARPPTGSRLTWAPFELDTDPTIVCQGDWLTNVGQDVLLLRKFQTERGHGPDAPVAREAVLQFADEPRAIAGYQKIAAWLSSCPATRQRAYAPTLGAMRTPSGPKAYQVGAFAGVWQQSSLPSDLAGVATFDQFVGRSGRRVLVFEYSQAVGPGVPDPDAPFFATLATAANRAVL